MGFDGLDGDAEVVGDLLVETAVDDALENLLLARRELGEQGFIETAAFLLHVAFTGFAEHALDELLEGGLLEGFFDEVDGAALEGVDEADWKTDNLHETLNKALVEDGGYKPRLAFGPVRVAISGRRVSPPLFESMEIVGKPLTIARLKGLREHL